MLLPTQTLEFTRFFEGGNKVTKHFMSYIEKIFLDFFHTKLFSI